MRRINDLEETVSIEYKGDDKIVKFLCRKIETYIVCQKTSEVIKIIKACDPILKPELETLVQDAKKDLIKNDWCYIYQENGLLKLAKWIDIRDTAMQEHYWDLTHTKRISDLSSFARTGVSYF